MGFFRLSGLMKYDISEIIKMIYQDIGFEDLTTNALINPDTKIDAGLLPGKKVFYRE